MDFKPAGRPPSPHSERFRNALWAWRTHRCADQSWSDLDNLFITRYLTDNGALRSAEYDRGMYPVIRVMERVYAEGRSPLTYRAKKRGKGTDLVEAFTKWLKESLPARDEFHHPIWDMLAGRRMPAYNDWMVEVHKIFARRGLLKFRETSLLLAREVAGKAFPAQQGNMEAIAEGARLIAREASLDSLMVLAFEYRNALDRFQPIEAQHYLDAFVSASRTFTEELGDEYLGNGIAAQIALRLFRNEWGSIGPEKWRPRPLKREATEDDCYGMSQNDLLVDTINYGPKKLRPMDELIVPGTPIIEPDIRMKWFAVNLEACATTAYLQAIGMESGGAEVRPYENGREILEKARTMWGPYEPAGQNVHLGFTEAQRELIDRTEAKARKLKRA